MAEALLELRGLVAGYGRGDVLRGVDLAVERGSITCLIGPNGAGKSTVLKAISGLLGPKEGTIRFLGRPIGGLSPQSVLGSGVVHVPQERSLFPSMSTNHLSRPGSRSTCASTIFISGAATRTPLR